MVTARKRLNEGKTGYVESKVPKAIVRVRVIK